MRHRNGQLADVKSPQGHLMRDMYGAIQVTGGQMLVMLVEPMLYIGFLDIAHMLCYPFGNMRHNLPTDTFIERLNVEICSMGDSRSFYRQKLERMKNDGRVTPRPTREFI